jgi:hypothetical protein
VHKSDEKWLFAHVHMYVNGIDFCAKKQGSRNAGLVRSINWKLEQSVISCF